MALTQKSKCHFLFLAKEKWFFDKFRNLESKKEKN